MAKKKTTKTGIALIKKSNDLIEARYKFDIWETRFFLSVLSKIHKDDDEFETYRIHYKDIIKTFGLKPTSSYELLRNAARSLMDKKVTVDYEENGHKREKIYHLIRHIDLLKEGRVGASDLEQQEYVDVVVESQMRPLLLHLQKNFTAYDLRNIVHLGVYPVRVYELLKQYESIGRRVLYIEDMKKMFNLTEEYPKFSNFFQKVIAPGIKEINKHTDLKILKVEKIKEGKKVVGLEFTFERKAAEDIKIIRNELPKESKRNLTLFEYIEEEMEDGDDAPNSVAEPMISFEKEVQSEQDRLFMQFQPIVVGEFGVSPTVFIAESLKFEEEQIHQAVRVTQRAIKDGKAKNSAAFFIDALRKGFTDSQEMKAQKQAEAEVNKANNQTIQGKIEEIEGIRAQSISDKIRALTTVRPEVTDEAIAAVKANKAYQRIINARGTDLTIDDFREDEKLRFAVKTEIIKAYESEFLQIIEGYDKQIELLKGQLKP
jgi:plasmid replication initiation protein